MADLLTDLYRQNEWANLRLIAVCRALSDEQLDATAPGAYGSIRDTLVHFVGAEALTVRRLGGAPSLAIRSRGAAWPGFDALEASVRECATALIERAQALGGSAIVVEEEPGVRVQIEANVLLIQVINHGAEHRGQVCTILSVLGALPSHGDDGQTIIDAWAWSDALGLARRVEEEPGDRAGDGSATAGAP